LELRHRGRKEVQQTSGSILLLELRNRGRKEVQQTSGLLLLLELGNRGRKEVQQNSGFDLYYYGILDKEDYNDLFRIRIPNLKVFRIRIWILTLNYAK
jgi:hypothetical protein